MPILVGEADLRVRKTNPVIKSGCEVVFILRSMSCPATIKASEKMAERLLI